MKKRIGIMFVLFLSVLLVACGGKSEPVKADYTTVEAETALKAGDDIKGKTVSITVDTYVPDGPLGYTIQTGEHLNFISADNPKVKQGDQITVKVLETTSTLGSFIMTYEKQ